MISQNSSKGQVQPNSQPPGSILQRHRRADDQATTSCMSGEFLFTGDMSCRLCPDSCAACVEETSYLDYPCTQCKHGFKLVPRDAKSDADQGGICSSCSSMNLLTSANSTRIRLVSSSGSTPVLMGRLEFVHNGTWYGVCDDGWTKINSDVVCNELHLGTSVASIPKYNSVDSKLPSVIIGLDEVKCEAGDLTLKQCKNSGFLSHDCAPSETIGIQCSGPSGSDSCLKECPKGQFEGQGTNSCELCDDECEACFSSADICTSCVPPYFLTGGAECKLECGVGFFSNLVTHKCEACRSECASCADGTTPDTCFSCQQGLVLHERQCLRACPSGTQLFIDEKNSRTCFRVCPEGFFSQSAICLPCNEECESCSISSTNCTTCSSGLFLAPSSAGFTCLDHCPLGSYSDSQRRCQECIDPNCKHCSSGGEYCLQCADGMVLEHLKCRTKCTLGLFKLNGECRAECPEGHFGDIASRSCKPCESLCRTCTSPGNRCTSCFAGFFLRDETCVRSCGFDKVAVMHRADNNVRLMEGKTPLDGRVEVLHDGELNHSLSYNPNQLHTSAMRDK